MSTHTCLVGQSNLFRAGLKMLLMQTPFEVAMEARSLDEIVELDWSEGLFLIDKPADVREIEHALVALRGRYAGCRIVLIAETIESKQLALSFACGADGYVLDEISPEALLESLKLVMLGEKVFPSRLALLLSDERGTARPALVPVPRDVPLSERELEIVRRLTEGMPNKVIASELQITEATVKVHLKTVLKKLGFKNRTQAAIWAVHHGLAAAPAVVRLPMQDKLINPAA